MMLENQAELKIAADAAALAREAASEFAKCAEAAVAQRGRFSVALSGGNTPRAVNELLAEQYKNSLPWEKIFFFFGDERHVPPTHPDSNYRMANESLFSRAPVPPENVFRMQTELAADRAAQKYEDALRQFFQLPAGSWPQFDLIFLGLGDDGHTASLFPGTAALNESSRLVVANPVEKLKTDRITFTFPVLNHAREVLFLVAGGGKAPILREVLRPSNGATYPAQMVHPEGGRVLWLADQEAARLL
ncbi:MAG TPA: 6-phosphogluconolactonase [Candidatus Angelobacter sp.]